MEDFTIVKHIWWEDSILRQIYAKLLDLEDTGVEVAGRTVRVVCLTGRARGGCGVSLKSSPKCGNRVEQI